MTVEKGKRTRETTYLQSPFSSKCLLCKFWALFSVLHKPGEENEGRKGDKKWTDGKAKTMKKTTHVQPRLYANYGREKKMT